MPVVYGDVASRIWVSKTKGLLEANPFSSHTWQPMFATTQIGLESSLISLSIQQAHALVFLFGAKQKERKKEGNIKRNNKNWEAHANLVVGHFLEPSLDLWVVLSCIWELTVALSLSLSSWPSRNSVTCEALPFPRTSKQRGAPYNNIKLAKFLSKAHNFLRVERDQPGLFKPILFSTYSNYFDVIHIEIYLCCILFCQVSDVRLYII